MKIHCDCGSILHDSDRSRKAHLIPDQSIDELLDEIDRAIEQTPRPLRSKEGACMRIRGLINEITRPAWQCSGCQRIYVDDQNGQPRAFDARAPEESSLMFQGRAGQ